jgi:cupin domain
MRSYPTIPGHVVDGWRSQDVRHVPGSEPVAFHYHDVDEWLQVLEGTITFFTAGERPYALGASDALSIPTGEVHRAEIGPGGAMYLMWLPVDMSGRTFQHTLDQEDMAVVRKNLDLPEVENRWDARSPETRVTGNRDGEFLDNFTSADLIFRNARGEYLTKQAYLQRAPVPFTRTPSDTVCILYRDAEHLLLSTVVQTQSTETGARQSYSNTRFFVRENGGWRCRVWMNFPQPAS